MAWIADLNSVVRVDRFRALQPVGDTKPFNPPIITDADSLAQRWILIAAYLRMPRR
jgi:hypothetical protein